MKREPIDAEFEVVRGPTFVGADHRIPGPPPRRKMDIGDYTEIVFVIMAGLAVRVFILPHSQAIGQAVINSLWGP